MLFSKSISPLIEANMTHWYCDESAMIFSINKQLSKANKSKWTQRAIFHVHCTKQFWLTSMKWLHFIWSSCKIAAKLQQKTTPMHWTH